MSHYLIELVDGIGLMEPSPNRPEPVSNRPDLHVWHQPRPWLCSDDDAIWCTHHGTCTCDLHTRRHDCALHGVDTDHPYHRELIGRRV